MLGVYGPAIMPMQVPLEGIIMGMPPHRMGVPVLPQHLLPGMPWYPGMSYPGKGTVTATPPATQLLPVCHSNLLEGLPEPIGSGS